jgi:hypothetical protein
MRREEVRTIVRYGEKGQEWREIADDVLSEVS